jgi:CRISPR-associated protein Cas1
VPARVLAAQLALQQAWERASSKSGMAGADGVRVNRFAKNAAAHLRVLESRLARETYRPHPLRAAELEKKNGSRRLLLIPCVADRIIQTAAALWLGARWNQQFDPASFAYRPGMGVHDALRALAELRDRGLRWVLDADTR